jgi:hypothetical protein
VGRSPSAMAPAASVWPATAVVVVEEAGWVAADEASAPAGPASDAKTIRSPAAAVSHDPMIRNRARDMDEL